MEEKKINKRIVFSVVAVLLLIAVVAGATYAFFSAGASSAAQTVTTATLALGFEEGELIRATNITPIADSEIKTKAVELPFSITNTGGQHMKVEIKLTDIVLTPDLKDIDFRWGLYNADTDVGLSFGFFKNIGNEKEITIYEDFVIDAGEPAKNYKVRVWIHDDGAEQNYMQGESFSAKVTVNGEAVEYTPESCFTFKYGNIIDYDVSCGGTDVVIPKTIDGQPVTNIGGNVNLLPTPGAFDSKGLTSIIIPNTVTSFEFTDDGIIGGNNLTNITIPESITDIPSYSTGFAAGNHNLETLRLPESITNIGDNAFYYVNFIKELVIPGSVTTIGAGAFGGYDPTGINSNPGQIADIVLMDGIKTINNYVFLGNQYSEIEIPSSVTTVQSSAFSSPNLTKLVVRGKSSLSDFTKSDGLTVEGVTIEFRP